MNKQRILGLARRAGLFALARWITRRELRILCYHGLWLGPGHFGNFLFMSPDRFEQRMRWLAASGQVVLPLGEALARLRDGTLPDRAVAITIDDGWQSTFTHMLPVLHGLRLPATVYVTSYHAQHQSWVVGPLVGYLVSQCTRPSVTIAHVGPVPIGTHELGTPAQREAFAQALSAAIEQQPVAERDAWCETAAGALGVDLDAVRRHALFRIMDADQVRAAADQGFDIQLHTHRHRIVDPDGADCLAREIADNRAWLQALVPGPLEHFCYPSGYHTPACFSVLPREAVHSATTTDTGLVSARANRYALPRILDGQAVSQLEFEAELSGFLELLRRGRRLLRRGG